TNHLGFPRPSLDERAAVESQRLKGCILWLIARRSQHMERRAFLVGSAFAVAGMATGPVSAQYFDNAWLKSPPQQPLSPADIESAVARLRKQFLAEFDAAYVENVIVPHFLV